MKGLKGLKGSADVGGMRGRVVKGRGIIGGGGDGGAAVGAGERGSDCTITAPTTLVALPVLEDNGGGGGGSGGAGTRGMGGRKIQAK